MTEPAAFQATYSDWKVIKGRKVVQIVLEMPLEAADSAYQVLGGMPIAATEIWCAVARLDKQFPRRSSPGAVEDRPRPAPTIANAPVGADNRAVTDGRFVGSDIADDGAKIAGCSAKGATEPQQRGVEGSNPSRSTRKSPAQVAGYLCTVQAFQRFLAEKYQMTWDECSGGHGSDSDWAASCVRELCKVNSRSELTDKNVEWNALRLAYQLWLNEPELVA